jgi:hypothetical protein
VTLLLYGGLLHALTSSWTNAYQPAGPLGWLTGGKPFAATIVVTAAVAAVTLVAARLLRYPLPETAEDRPATPERPDPAGHEPVAAPEPAAPARVG